MNSDKTGEYLALLRKKCGMTQQAVADVLHLSNKTISKWENGSGFPDISVLPALSELFDVTVDEILAGGPLSQKCIPEQGMQVQEKRKYLLRKAKQRFEICMVFAMVCAIIWSLLNVPYISTVCGVFCPALVLVGWILIQTTAKSEKVLKKDIYTFSVRLTIPVLLLWEWGLCSPLQVFILSQPNHTPGDSFSMFRWTWMFWAIIAIITVWLLQLLLRNLTEKESWVAKPWSLVLLSGILLEIGLGYSLHFTQRYFKSDKVVAEVLSELNKINFGAIIPVLKASMWIIAILTLATILVLRTNIFRRKQKKAGIM